jgi:UDP-N-acetylmuramyl pentapeptide synthase
VTTDEFDTTDVTGKLREPRDLKADLDRADTINGKLMRMIEGVLTSWLEDPSNATPESLRQALEALEAAYNESKDRKL